MKPAATIKSYHSCPASDGPKAHVGGVGLTASKNVTMGGVENFALRVGDKLQCIGSLDAVATGSTTVFINGKGATRIGDSSEHGGLLQQDGVNNVLIG